MLTVNVISVGKLKEKYLKEAISEYEKRLKAFCNIKFVELSEERLSDNPSDKEILSALSKEGEVMKKYFTGSSYNFAMCIEGKQLSSTDFSKAMENASIQGKSTLNFFIGSSFGLCDTIKNSCNYKLSISKMTFPHQLARVILTEQIYRGFSILNNSKYHK